MGGFSRRMTTTLAAWAHPNARRFVAEQLDDRHQCPKTDPPKRHSPPGTRKRTTTRYIHVSPLEQFSLIISQSNWSKKESTKSELFSAGSSGSVFLSLESIISRDQLLSCLTLPQLPVITAVSSILTRGLISGVNQIDRTT